MLSWQKDITCTLHFLRATSWLFVTTSDKATLQNMCRMGCLPSPTSHTMVIQYIINTTVWFSLMESQFKLGICINLDVDYIYCNKKWWMRMESLSTTGICESWCGVCAAVLSGGFVQIVNKVPGQNTKGGRVCKYKQLLQSVSQTRWNAGSRHFVVSEKSVAMCEDSLIGSGLWHGRGTFFNLFPWVKQTKVYRFYSTWVSHQGINGASIIVLLLRALFHKLFCALKNQFQNNK